MRDHLLGFPPVIAQVEAILNPPPVWTFWVEWDDFPVVVAAAPTPEELAESRKKAQTEDAKAYDKMKAPASKPVKRDPPYLPEGWGGDAFVSHDYRGRDSVAPKISGFAMLLELWAGDSILPEPTETQAAEVSGEWQSGAPPSVGWYAVREANPEWFGPSEDENGFLWFDGSNYTLWIGYIGDSPEASDPSYDDEWTNLKDAQWRGPRLTGPSWPEPGAAS